MLDLTVNNNVQTFFRWEELKETLAGRKNKQGGTKAGGEPEEGEKELQASDIEQIAVQNLDDRKATLKDDDIADESATKRSVKDIVRGEISFNSFITLHECTFTSIFQN